jgi:hypothetical protein
MDIFRHLKNKRWLIIGMVILAGALLTGCMGPQFTYQGVLMDASGNPYNGSVTITYRIFDDEDAGTEIFSQSETVTVTEGRFDSIVGPASAIASLDPADLSQPLWIELQIDDGTYAETLEPRQRLYGAPYAFTLMPGAVVSAAIAEEVHGPYNVNAVASVQNEQVSDSSFTALPALRVVGEKGIELVGASGSVGTIYSDLDNTSSDLFLRSNDNFNIYLDNDNNETGTFWVYSSPTTNYCYIQNGNLGCTGTKSSITEVDEELRTLYAIESPDVWFEDFGTSQLVNGKISVPMESLFAQTVNLDVDYHVFLTPLGDCNGLYVTDKTATGFEVRELGGGASNVSFDYRIVAKRAGYESQHMEIVPTGSEGLGQ